MAQHVVGIDLGTTNTVVAAGSVERPGVAIAEVPQLVGPAEVAALPQLPSVLYLPHRDELRDGATRLPWGEEPGYYLGHYAVHHGAKVPGRTVSSAKSWLSFAGVDRSAPILPWGGADDVPRLSPVEASARVLGHVRAAWDQAHPEAPLRDQDVILTVPASFDEVARNLTAQAAAAAGLGHARLVEEPQAAFYDFIMAHQQELAAVLEGVGLVLVIDVGGGTTDLTLVQVSRRASEPPGLERIAVGDHLMLGGDNMDMSVARHVEQQLTGAIGSLDAAQWGALVQASRLAKETLLADAAPASVQVHLPGRGRRLVGGGQSLELARQVALELLLDGFLPLTAPDQTPRLRSKAGLTELALPYADDPAISRHLCGFLRHHAEAVAASGAKVVAGLPRPDAVLLNGGVFNSPAVRQRLGALLQGWFGEAIPELPHASLELAVARGAAYYGLVRRGKGVRIGGGSPRAYFVGVEDDAGQRKALCVAPRGMLEGAGHELERTFRLRLGQPVSFPLYTSTRGAARAGAIVDPTESIEPLPRLQTVLRPPDEVPVRLRAQLTEVGTLEISLHMTDEALPRWSLSFSTRAEAAEGEGAQPAPAPALHANLEVAKDLIAGFYGAKDKGAKPGAVKQIGKQLEKLLGPRDGWSLGLSRELVGPFLVGAKRRRRSADHERLFFQWLGYCARPGFGAPFDDWRAGEIVKLLDEGVQYVNDKAVWSAWWILWRRVSGGLDAQQQRRLLELVWPWLGAKEGAKPKGAKPHGEDEMLRLLASLERLPAETKQEIGDWAVKRLAKGAQRSWWPVGRLGARQPFAGSAHDVGGREVAERWLHRLFECDWRDAEGAALAAALLARRTGDRERDVDDKVRAKVVERLDRAKAAPAWIRMVREATRLSAQDEAQVFGDSLPVGLKLG